MLEKVKSEIAQTAKRVGESAQREPPRVAGPIEATKTRRQSTPISGTASQTCSALKKESIIK